MLIVTTNADGNEVAALPCVGDDEFVTLLIKNLNLSSFYYFTIVSQNGIGEQSTKATPFCKYYISIPNFWINKDFNLLLL